MRKKTKRKRTLDKHKREKTASNMHRQRLGKSTQKHILNLLMRDTEAHIHTPRRAESDRQKKEGTRKIGTYVYHTPHTNWCWFVTQFEGAQTVTPKWLACTRIQKRHQDVICTDEHPLQTKNTNIGIYQNAYTRIHKNA